MKNTSRRRIFVAALIVVTAGISSSALGAPSIYFDVNGNGTGSGIVAATDYSWENAFWNTTATGITTGTTNFVEGDFARFAAGTDTAAKNYSVTASTNHLIGGMFLQSNGGGTVTINGPGVLNIDPTGGVDTNNVTGAGPIQGFLVNSSAQILTINASLGGAGGVENELSGSLNLYGNNTYSGGTLLGTGAGLNFNNSNSFGTGTITWGTTSPLLAAPAAASAINIANAMQTKAGSTLIMASFNSQAVTWSGAWNLAAGVSTLDIRSTANTTISGVIGGADPSSALVKGGASTSTGVLTLTGANTFAGGATVGVGTVSVSNIGNSGDASNLGTNGTINLGGGATTTTTGILKYTGTGETSNKVINLGGTTGGGTIDQSGTGLLKFTSNTTATGLGIKTLTLQGSTGGTGEISGIIVDNSATNKTSVTKAGTGKWTLSNANTYTGGTSISGGTLGIGNSSALGTGTFTFSGSGTFDNTSGSAMVLSNKLALSGGSPTFVGTNDITFDNNATVALSGASGGNRTVTVSASTLALNGVVSDGGINMGITKAGAGTLILAGTNTATASFRTNAGILSVANIGNSGSPSNLGTNGSFTFGGGTLKYTGLGEISNKSYDFSTSNSNGTLDQSGTSGLLQVTGNVSATGANAHILTIQGSTDGTGEIVGVISNGSGTGTSLVKAGTGTWTLSGASTYSGTTTVSGGALIVNGSTAGTGAVSVATATLGGTGSVAGVVTANSGGNISPGTAATPIGTFAVGALTFNTGSSFAYDLNSDTSTGDLLKVNGDPLATNVTINGGTLAVNDIGSTILVGTKFTLINYVGSLIGSFDSLTEGSTITTPSGNEFVLSYNDPGGANDANVVGGSGNFVTLTAVPEANAFWLGGAICLVLGLTVGTRKMLGSRVVA